MTPFQALTVAIIQGATELFPVSSLGHAVVLPSLLGWNLDQQGPGFLPFLVMLHVGTAAALLAYFRRDWWALLRSILGSGPDSQIRASRRLGWLVVIATIPAVIAGGALEHLLRRIFATPALAAAFLVGNGILLLAGEWLRARSTAPQAGKPITALTRTDALIIGVWQCLALLPGLSRSGATMVGGILRGVNHEGSAHFSFLIAFPIILAATVLEIPKLVRSDVPSGTLELATICAAVSGVVAYASTALMMNYFKHNDRQALAPFAIYCILFGSISLFVLRRGL